MTSPALQFGVETNLSNQIDGIIAFEFQSRRTLEDVKSAHFVGLSVGGICPQNDPRATGRHVRLIADHYPPDGV
ncbi:MAG: hypothetical protein ABJ327_15035 [Litoreibacter sp.]